MHPLLRADPMRFAFTFAPIDPSSPLCQAFGLFFFSFLFLFFFPPFLLLFFSFFLSFSSVLLTVLLPQAPPLLPSFVCLCLPLSLVMFDHPVHASVTGDEEGILPLPLFVLIRPLSASLAGNKEGRLSCCLWFEFLSFLLCMVLSLFLFSCLFC
jgi:hypothetical protein